MSHNPSATEDFKKGHELYLMRHAAALARETGGALDDSKRPLTPDGKAKLKEIAGGLGRLGFAVDWVVTSPLVRAVESAEIVAESLGRVALDFCDALRPGGTAEALLAFLAKQPARKRILLVGHEPGMSELAAHLLGAGRHTGLSFKKGGCCLITLNEFPPQSPGRLVWWLTPKVMRKLA